MWIACWNCGEDIWMETQKICRHCDMPAHRCLDCIHYSEQGPMCNVLNIDLDPDEAARPTRLSMSANCQDYQTSREALLRGQAHEGEPRHKPKTAPPVPAAPAAAAAGAAPAAAPHIGDDGEYITIRRESPLKRPAHPAVVAHRGASASAPENTLAAIRAALAEGTNGIELDVHFTRDAQPVVFHDATVDRCTDGSGNIADLTLAEVQTLDAGSWFSAAFAGERVPTLDEALEAITGNTFIALHLRSHENETDRHERTLVEAVARHDCRRRTVVNHHTRHGLQRLRELEPKLRLCWIPYGGEPPLEYIDDAYLLGCRIIQPRISLVDEAFVKYAHDKDMWVTVFWADEVEDMKRLIALQVDAIITNYPGRLREVLHGGG